MTLEQMLAMLAVGCSLFGFAVGVWVTKSTTRQDNAHLRVSNVVPIRPQGPNGTEIVRDRK